MKLIALSALLAGALAAESWSGHIIDTNCSKKDATTHTKDCTLGCAKSGLGVLTADGKFVKFDEAGTAKAVAALKASSKKADMKGTVTGTMEGGVIKVESVSLD